VRKASSRRIVLLTPRREIIGMRICAPSRQPQRFRSLPAPAPIVLTSAESERGCAFRNRFIDKA
jgi:hypothetical protein